MATIDRMIHELPAAPHGRTGWPWTVDAPGPESGIGAEDTSVMEKPWPSFSIIIPSYNQGEFLEETLRSVLLQGIPNLEVMVIDGGSDDQSCEILERYSPWLTYFVSEPDDGQSHAINKGWERATGDWVAYLNSDDMYCPGALQAVATAWKNDPAVAVIAGGVRFVDENTQLLSEHYPFLRIKPLAYRSDPSGGEAQPAAEVAADELVYAPLDLSILRPSDWFLPQQATFFARRHLDVVGRYLRKDLHYTMDRELMYRLCRHGKTVLLSKSILAGDRHHASTKRLSQSLRMYREDAIALAYCTWGGRRDARLRRRVARLRLAQGHYNFARQSSSSVSALYHYGVAAFCRPGYLLNRGFISRVARRLSPWN